MDIDNSKSCAVEFSRKLIFFFSSFTNRISGTHQDEEPTQFYGGIMADPMGLGKTLSMIALIASDTQYSYADMSPPSGANSEESSGQTLVIVPPPCRFRKRLNKIRFHG